MTAWDKRIPVLVKTLDEMEFAKGFEEPEPEKCDNCGSHIFYIVDRFGLHKEKYRWMDEFEVIGETEESKKYKKWEVGVVDKQFFCAVCGVHHYGESIWQDEYVAKEFEDKRDADWHEEALDCIKYPTTMTESKKQLYKKTVKEIKDAIDKQEEIIAKIIKEKIKHAKTSTKGKSKRAKKAR